MPHARISGQWTPLAVDSKDPVQFFVTCAVDGSYHQIALFDRSDWQARTDLKLRMTMRAHSPFAEAEPSAEQVFEVPARSQHTLDFQLGAPRPTIAVHVRDRSGRPVTEFWVEALPTAAGAVRDVNWPQRYKDFPEGIAELAIPKESFRVEVHRYRGVDSTTVGPFDPARLPARIEVTLGG